MAQFSRDLLDQEQGDRNVALSEAPPSGPAPCPPQTISRRGKTAPLQREAVPPVGMPIWKRALDLACIFVAAPVLLPVMLVITAMIKLVSSGPALFRQQRIGYGGKPFTCFKFRTMHVNADTSVHQGHLNRLMDSNLPMQKLDAVDPRVIRGGRWLRSLGLDELPQIFNVLRGEMSLVGPRPCVPYEYANYTPRHRLRCQAVPGLTGLWQVSGKNRTTFEQMIDFDIYYAGHKSLWLDVKIITKTVPALLVQTRQLKKDSETASQPVALNPNNSI